MSDVDRDRLRGQPLSPREIEVICHLAMDGSPKHEVIAREMGLSPNTAKWHLYKAGCKLDVYDSYTGLLMEALRQGILTIEQLEAPGHVVARSSTRGGDR